MHGLDQVLHERRPIQLIEIIASVRVGVVWRTKFKYKDLAVKEENSIACRLRAAFLRINDYACAMILWKFVSRCTAHGGKVAEYALPFETELKLHPSKEELQEFFVKEKTATAYTRPLESTRRKCCLGAASEYKKSNFDHLFVFYRV